MQCFVIFFACYDENAFNLWIGCPLGVDVLTDIMDYTIADLIKILPDTAFLISTDTLHDKVLCAIDDHQCIKALLFVNLDFEIIGNLFEIIYFGFHEALQV